MQRYRLQEWLGYINSEIHKTFSPFFNPATTEQAKEAAKAVLARRLGYAEQALGDKPFLLGDAPSSYDATAHAFLTNLLWAPLDTPLRQHARSLPNLDRYCLRMKARWFG